MGKRRIVDDLLPAGNLVVSADDGPCVRRDHAVLAGTLGTVEGLVRGCEQRRGRGRVGEGGDAEARRDRDEAARMGRHRPGRERAPEAVGKLMGAVEIGLREEHRELLAAVACGEVDLADGRAEDVRERLQHVVAGLMAVAVVHLLEVVQVGQDQRQAAAEALRAGDLGLERLLEVAPIGKLGQAVRVRLPLDEAMEARVLERDRGLGAEPVGELAGVVAEVGFPRRQVEDAGFTPVRAERDGERPSAVGGVPSRAISFPSTTSRAPAAPVASTVFCTITGSSA